MKAPAIYQEALKECPAISVDADIMSGAPCIRGTRIPVAMVVVEAAAALLAAGGYAERVTPEQSAQALRFAAIMLGSVCESATDPRDQGIADLERICAEWQADYPSRIQRRDQRIAALTAERNAARAAARELGQALDNWGRNAPPVLELLAKHAKLLEESA